MRYVLIDDRGYDLSTKEFENKDEAIKQGDYDWNHLTDSEKRKSDFYLLESNDPDDDSMEHLDGDIIKYWRKG